MLYLVHGALGSAVQLSPLVAALQGFDARVVELAGHGETALGEQPFSIDGFVAQVAQQLDTDGMESADFFGYSMGGYVALALALAHPERVGRVVTLGTKFEWTPEGAAREASRLDPDTIRARVPAFADQLRARHSGSGGWEGTLLRTAHLLTALGAAPVLGADELARITQPVCVMVGDRDATVSAEESARISRLLPSGSLAVLPLTPHPFERVDHALLATLVTRAR